MSYGQPPVKIGYEFNANTDQARLGTRVKTDDELATDRKDTNENWRVAGYDELTGEYTILVRPEFLKVSSTGKSALTVSGTVTMPAIRKNPDGSRSFVDHTLTINMYRKATVDERVSAALSGQFEDKSANAAKNTAKNEALALIDAGRARHMSNDAIRALVVKIHGEKFASLV